MGMQTNGRLITYIEDTGQTRANLSSQANTLGLSSGKGPRGPIHSHIVQTDPFQEVNAALNFF